MVKVGICKLNLGSGWSMMTQNSHLRWNLGQGKQASTPTFGAFGTRVVVGEVCRPAKGRLCRAAGRPSEDFDVHMVKNRHCQPRKWLKML